MRKERGGRVWKNKKGERGRRAKKQGEEERV